MKCYHVDAFAEKPFEGNPAAVCVLDKYPSDALMQQIAGENNLSETAFAVKEGENYHLRWFTPGGEIDLCGHATLGTAYVLFTFFEKEAASITFHTMSGPLTVVKKGDLLEMDFPAYELKQVPVTPTMEEAFGIHITEAWLGRDLLCVTEDAAAIPTLTPDQAKLEELDGLLRISLQKAPNTIPYPVPLRRSWLLLKTPSAAAVIATLFPCGHRNWARIRSLPVRPPNGAAHYIVKCREIA